MHRYTNRRRNAQHADHGQQVGQADDPTIRGRGRSGRPWERVKSQVYREETHCWLCHAWVDQRLPATDPAGRTADHLVQLCHQGPALDRANLRLAHRSCNTTRSNRLRNINKQRCACQVGQPCALLDPRRTLSVDLTTV